MQKIKMAVLLPDAMFLFAGCSDKPDFTVDSKFIELSKSGETRCAVFRDHLA